jgi:hypothetical protein
MVFNTTFNNISAMSWQSVLFMEETELLRENHRPVASYWQTLSHNLVSSAPRHEEDIKIKSLTCSALLICCIVGDLRNPQYRSHMNDLMSWIYSDVINTVMTLFVQLDCSIFSLLCSNCRSFVLPLSVILRFTIIPRVSKNFLYEVSSN